MSFSKLSLALAGTGTTGVGVVGIVGWQLLFSDNSSELPSYIIDDIVLDENPTGITFRDYGCFKKFFDGVEINQEESSEETEEEDESETSNLVSPSSNYLVSNSSGIVGCANMKMSHNVHDLKWFLSGEVVIKGDKAGLALWFEGFGKMGSDTSNNSSDYYQELIYRVAFLEPSTENKWEAKTGYSWKDKGISTNSRLNIYVKSPDKLWINAQHSSDIESLISKRPKENIQLERFNYFGVWEYTGAEGDKHPLSEIKVSGSSGQENILGKDGDFSEINLDNRGGKIYHTSNKKWDGYKSTTSQDISSNLNDWYQPFKDKKGQWKTLSVYCSSSDHSNKIEGICNRKQQ